jgi:hypothetical protein
MGEGGMREDVDKKTSLSRAIEYCQLARKVIMIL